MIYLKRKKAFTLIELLVVIVIIGVIATISVVSFNSYIKKANDSKTINALVEYQNLLDRFYTVNEYYPEPDSNGWVCLGNYSSQEVCYYYLWNGSKVEYHGDDKLKAALLAELGAEFNTANYETTSEFSESLLYLRSANGLGYSIWFMAEREDFDCTRLKGLNNQDTGVLTSEKNSWIGSFAGGKEVTYCYYCIIDGKAADCNDL